MTNRLVRTVQTFRETMVDIEKKTSIEPGSLNQFNDQVHQSFDTVLGTIIDSCLEAGNPRCNATRSYNLTGLGEYEGEFSCKVSSEPGDDSRPCSLAGDTHLGVLTLIADELKVDTPE